MRLLVLGSLLSALACVVVLAYGASLTEETNEPWEPVAPAAIVDGAPVEASAPAAIEPSAGNDAISPEDDASAPKPEAGSS